MSISSAINNAMSGLTLSSRSAEVVSTNIANSTDQSYARREIDHAALARGGLGARAGGVIRVQDPGLVADLRAAGASASGAATRLEGLERIESALGTPEDGSSILGRISAFEDALTSAATRPDSQVRLEGVRQTGEALAAVINGASDSVQDLRAEADRAIGRETDAANEIVAQVADLNRSIVTATARGQDVNSLLDERQRRVDALSNIITVREVPREKGGIALFGDDGTKLVDGGRHVRLEFETATAVTPDTTREGGQLSGLSIDGKPALGALQGGDSGGSLAAHFEMRDAVGSRVQGRLDAFARDLLDRVADTPDMAVFSDPAEPGMPERGLAARLVFASVEDDELWRLRDGLSADAPGPVGDPKRINALSEALTEPRHAASSAIPGSARSYPELGADMLSMNGAALHSARSEKSFADAELGTFRDARLADGVDTDKELQGLLQLERTYAANARVLRAADSMIATLLEI